VQLKDPASRYEIFINDSDLYDKDNIRWTTSTFCDFVDRIYLIKLETKESTDTAKSTSCLNIQLEIDSESKLRMKLYDIRWTWTSNTCIFLYYLDKIFSPDCYVPCLSGNASVFASRNYNLDRKLKTQIWSLWKHKIKTHK
jgi:hypothetical protein